ncbi:BQ5605_C012g06721 [Microbotryum silenes-dioicae]|uniref:BQ5605_C012g06721 protein n=1 Tax=Microbotryum silenes-dioicae TaxID=796604 RepID=A0A2X0NW45_9BASI|nr:BQ5605_C012g06721 [Microbotryum silenes-dioicae]
MSGSVWRWCLALDCLSLPYARVPPAPLTFTPTATLGPPRTTLLTPVTVASTEQSSCQKWLADLSKLRHEARRFFGDVCWAAHGPTRPGRSCPDEVLVYAHKAIVYSRSSGSFQERFIQCSPALHCSDSVASSFNTGTSARDDARDAHFLRSTSSASLESIVTATTSSATLIAESSDHVVRLMLADTDPALFEAWLDVLYLGTQGTEGVHVLFEGFHESIREDSVPGLTGIAKLREDLLYCWRSKLYADVTIVLDDGGYAASSFASHRAILAARVPYFACILLGEFSDAQTCILTLPSPLFSSASFTFILGYVYSGTLHFSSRKFDLATALEIWRGAAFLGLDLLQEQVEVSIESMMTPNRAARIYRFALAPDVQSARLARGALMVITGHFGQVWDSAYIGTLDHSSQKALFDQVCSGISAETSTSVVKQALQLRKRIETNRHAWVHHIRAMLDAVEEHLVEVLSRDLAAVVTSESFVDLIDGVGFSADVLEHLLELVVRGLAESRACATYQALVGSVLLREEGILIDAKVLVEDARNGIAKYIKTRWMSIRDTGEFTRLQAWCLKELADHISVAEADLLYQPTASKRPPIRTSVITPTIARPPSKLVLNENAQWQLASGENQLRALDSRSARSTDLAAHIGLPIVDVPRRATHIDPPGSAARGDERPSDRTSAARHARSLGSASSSSRIVRSASASNAAHHRVPVGRRGPAGSTSTEIGPGTAETRVSTSFDGATTVRAGRREAGVLPTLASEVSTAAKTRSRTGSVDSRASPTSSGRIHRPSKNPPAIQRLSAPSTIVPLRCESVGGPATSRETSDSTSTSKPPTGISPLYPPKLARRTTSAISLTAVRAPSSRPTALNSKKSSPDSEAHLHLSKATPQHSANLYIQDRITNEDSLAICASRDARTKLPFQRHQNPRGTTLLAGIPCIATINQSDVRRIQIKAVVRYIGPVEWATPDTHWVGVEVAEGDIPAEVEANDEWNDGSRDGFRYFDLRRCPEPTARRDAEIREQAEYQLAFATREAPTRSRPRSSLGVNSRGESMEVSRGLFVRPSSIVYVL